MGVREEVCGTRLVSRGAWMGVLDIGVCEEARGSWCFMTVCDTSWCFVQFHAIPYKLAMLSLLERFTVGAQRKLSSGPREDAGTGHVDTYAIQQW